MKTLLLTALGVLAVQAQLLATWGVEEPSGGSGWSKSATIAAYGASDENAANTAGLYFGYDTAAVPPVPITEDSANVSRVGTSSPAQWSHDLEPPTGGWHVDANHWVDLRIGNASVAGHNNIEILP